MITGADFNEKYALRTFRDGGIVVDLRTGAYLRMNRSAALICAAISRDASTARLEIGSALGIAQDAVDAVIQNVIDGLRIDVPRRVRPDPFVYGLSPDAGGYVLSANESPKLLVTAHGERVSVTTPAVAAERNLYEYLRALAPRLAFLRGHAVIHGSACVLPAVAFAICGDSGAGKTTTARAFGAAGAEVVAEDMLVIDSAAPLTVKGSGERAIHEWAVQAAEQLRHDRQVDGSTLERAWEGSSRPIQQLWFITAEGRSRSDGRIVHAQVDSIDSTLTTMASVFLGGTGPDDWRRFLNLSATIAEHVSVFRTHVPSGVDRLSQAAAAYMRSSAS